MQMKKVYRPLCEGIIQNLQEIFNQNKTAGSVVEKALKANKKWGSRDRKFVAGVTYDIVRNWRMIKFCAKVDERKITQANQYWTMLGAWLIMDDYELPAWEEFAELNKEEIAALKLEAQNDFKIKYSLTDWLNEYGREQLPDTWEEEIAAMSTEADVFLRVNTAKIGVEECAFRLQEQGVEVELVEGSDQALRLIERKRIDTTDVFKKGMVEVQDAGSQLIAPLLRPRSGEKVIDACAGAGGKTLNLADWMRNKGEILALDIYPKKLEELANRAKRNKIDIVKTAIAEEAIVAKYKNWADKLLLDVPCSGSGTFKRNIDAKWKLKPAFMEEIVSLQAKLFQNYSSMLKQGGQMVYATCSIFPAENELQVKAFLKANPNFKLIKQKHISPAKYGWDGFYMALLKKL